MKTIGMLGGMSWESTATYYRILNEGIKSALGGFHSARIAMVSVDFDEMEKLQHTGGREQMARLLGAAAKSVEAAGADFLLICTNTMHKVAPQIEQAISIPLLHIADATAEQLVRDRISCVGLLGTQFTMEQDFYKRRLTEKFGIKVVIPDAGDRELVHEVIYDELCMGKITDNSRSSYLHIIDKPYPGDFHKIKRVARTFSKTTSSPVWCACRLSPYLALFIRKSFYNHLGWSRSRTRLD